jgi:phosphate transport system permease protein
MGLAPGSEKNTVPSGAVLAGRLLRDRWAGKSFFILSSLPLLILGLILITLLLRTWPIFAKQSLPDLLFSGIWKPFKGQFGYYPFILGTLWVTVLAMLLAVPPCLLTAIYLAEYAGATTRTFFKPLADLLAGIPSVVYGVWGLVVVVPWIQQTATPWSKQWLHFLPFFRTQNTTGYGILAGGIVLAVMVTPVIVSIVFEVLQAVPFGLREASMAMGATRWQTIKAVVLPRAFPGILAAVVLGFSRAFGETMAVLMVVGNVPQIPKSIFDSAYPLTALIANNYGEMLSIPLYDAALMGAALMLLIVILIFNILATLILRRVYKGMPYL